MTALTLKYRPRVLGDVVGQKKTTDIIRSITKNPETKVPPALIFGGTRGSGKTTAARVMSAALNCKKRTSEGDPCGECGHCEGVWRSNSTSVLEIDAASNNGVEAIRKLTDLTQFAHEGEWRVVVLDEAHMLSTAAWNALLKTLEEPPPQTVFVMLTTETHKIPETIKSRSMIFEFMRITTEVILGRLKVIAKAEGIEVEEDLLAEIARHARGGMRDAVMTLDQVRLAEVSEASEFRARFGALECAPELLRKCVSGDVGAVVTIAGEAVARTGDAGALVQELTEVLRDVLVVQAGGTPPCLPQAIPERKELAFAIPQALIAPALRVLWSSRDRLRGEDDQVTAAQVTCVLLSDALAPAVPKNHVPITTVKEAPLTLAEMQAMAGGS